MQSYIDFFIANWFVILPIILILVVIIGLLVKKGHLESLDLFGIKINFQTANKSSTYSGERSLKKYTIRFTKTASDNLSSLKISEDKVISLIENEFKHHINYFLWDLQDYPLPVQQNFIVILDKIEKAITIKAIRPSDFNESQLASINNLLADYRRLTRYKYRTVSDYILRPETIREIIYSHQQLLFRLIKHYSTYEEPKFEGYLGTDRFAHYNFFLENAQIPEIAKLLETMPNNKTFTFNLAASFEALREIDKLIHDVENEFISSHSADREIVLSLERSLQYIHKTINLLLAD